MSRKKKSSKSLFGWAVAIAVFGVICVAALIVEVIAPAPLGNWLLGIYEDFTNSYGTNVSDIFRNLMLVDAAFLAFFFILEIILVYSYIHRLNDELDGRVLHSASENVKVAGSTEPAPEKETKKKRRGWWFFGRGKEKLPPPPKIVVITEDEEGEKSEKPMSHNVDDFINMLKKK